MKHVLTVKTRLHNTLRTYIQCMYIYNVYTMHVSIYTLIFSHNKVIFAYKCTNNLIFHDHDKTTYLSQKLASISFTLMFYHVLTL